MEELFRSIEWYEGLYQVSNLGNVRSLNYKHTGQSRVLKPRKHTDGYLQVMLCKDGKPKMYYVHRLVAQAFIPNPNNLPEINHIDEDKTNNVVTNLEYCTHAYNMTYGTRKQRSAESNINNPKRSKKVLQLTLDGKIVREWASTMECGRNGFDQGHVAACCRGELKMHKGYRWVYAEDYEQAA